MSTEFLQGTMSNNKKNNKKKNNSNKNNMKNNNVTVKISPAKTSAVVDDDNEEDDEEEDDQALKEERDRIFRNISQMDPFDQMKARADSGGSMYGVFKKEFQLIKKREDLIPLNSLATDDDADEGATASGGLRRRSASRGKQKFKSESSAYNVKKNYLCPPDPNIYGSGQPPTQLRHHRSKSLVHRHKDTDDSKIIRYLHDYNKTMRGDATESGDANRGHLSDYRRHSEATMNDRLLRDAQTFPAFGNVLDPNLVNFNQLLLSNLESRQSTLSTTISSLTSTLTSPAVTTQVPTSQSSHEPRSPLNRLQSIQLPTLQLGPSHTVNVCRRRSFSIRQNEICNEGDDEVLIVTNDEDEATGAPPQAILIGPCPEVPGFVSSKSRQLSWQDSRRRKNSFKNYLTSGAKDLLTGICSTQQHGDAMEGNAKDDMPLYKVVILGGPGVGKSGLLQQFLTSNKQPNHSFDDPIKENVMINLPNESAILQFFDYPYSGEDSKWYGNMEYHCFLVLYSITERRSFDRAIEFMDLILEHEKTKNKPVILVANKNDMERARLVGTREGETAAEIRRCEFMNVSVMINHQTNDLLFEVYSLVKKGLISRTRRASSLRPPSRNHRNHSGDFSGERPRGSLMQGSSPRESIWSRIRRSSFRRRMSKSCENLL